MRKTLGMVTIVVIVLGVIGFSRGWFSLTRERARDETNLHLRIDREKIREDTEHAAGAARELGGQIEERIGRE